MTITEAQRFEMHLGLRDKLGDDVANTLMEHLPPSGWSDVARTHDIDRLDTKIDAVEKRLDAKIDNLESRMNSEFAIVHRDIKGLKITLHVTIGIMITAALGLFGFMYQISQTISGG